MVRIYLEELDYDGNDMSNACLEAGCFGKCCRRITMHATANEVTALFPYALYVSNARFVREMNRPTQISVVVRDGLLVALGADNLGITGLCPNFNITTGECDRYADRPEDCQNLEVNSPKCRSLRCR